MARSAYILLGLLAGGCSSTVGPEPDSRETVLHDTTISRHDGSVIALEELQALRFSAEATADTVARIERELREPWAEDRTPAVLIENVTLRNPAESRLARTLWESAEPVGRGLDRSPFREFGFFSNQVSPALFAPRIRPSSLEAFVEELLKTHDDSTNTLMLLAAWRRFAPMMQHRGRGYLASAWKLELDYVQPLTVGLADSLLGPHLRCAVSQAENVSFPGPTETFDGYSTSVMLIDLLRPGAESPVADAVAVLAQLASGASLPLVGFTVSSGPVSDSNELDSAFLNAALRGLTEGHCTPEALPAAVSRFTVTFSYLIELAEARATLGFLRKSAGWELDLFEYHPAAASMIGGSATLDLLPAIRDLMRRNQRG